MPAIRFAMCLALLNPALGRAQSVLRGRITSQGQPIAHAEIGVTSRDVRAESTADGTYALTIGGVGVVEVSVRAVGYYPAFRRLIVADDDTVVAHFSLDRVAQRLESLTVTAPAAAVGGKMQGFEERRQAGLGTFLTREWLAEREHAALTSVLRMTPGLNLVRRPSDCGGGFALATGRGGAVNQQRWMRCESPESPPLWFPLACYLAIYLDGLRIWSPGQLEPPDIDKVANVVSLEGIELYRGPSEVPTEFQGTGNACGAALLWTRTGGR